MRTLFFLLFFTTVALAESYPRFATGPEAGVTRVKTESGTALGTSWAWHFEYRPDRFVGFFGHAGQNAGEGENKRVYQTFFAGGGELALLPVVDLKLGLSQVIAQGASELGPLAGVTVSQRSGVFRPGVTAEMIRSSGSRSVSLRAFLYFDL